MSDLPTLIKNIQRAVGEKADGIFGPITAAAVWRALNHDAEPVMDPATVFGIDERSAGNLATLDTKAQPLFSQFLRQAKATAATFGCDYILIGGDRTWDEQDALYAQPHDGRDNDGDGRIDEADEKVTNAKGGQSNHNFKIAGDFGVFRGKAYLDATDPQLAAKVHAACSLQAMPCGLEWGGSWKTFKDTPHYEVATGLTLAQKRDRFERTGSVLS
ncbi:MAG: M15 family metallopeptidase [Luteolibacter sp.]|uniref:M15 family metallopeptidase n=1 Tax=Luteolibacter sp. TaxID=1962973 RepID=UPI0032646AD4